MKLQTVSSEFPSALMVAEKPEPTAAQGLRDSKIPPTVKVGSIALDEGFQVQCRKTRIMRAATQQAAAGIVLNRRMNLKRTEYDQLKAIVHNCARFGPSQQNRDGHADFQSHLRGRLDWLRQLHPERGKKLIAMFQAIDWNT